ncbi:MAG: HNH endonuclease signature motif containing protein, partial [Mucinivorans sp.]
RYFSKTGCAASGLGGDYLSGSSIRQDYLETVIKWISAATCEDEIKTYMSYHQHDPNAVELWDYFQKVIRWVKEIFTDVESEMKGLDWGRLYEKYHNQAYDPQKVAQQVKKLYADPYVMYRKGVFEYILSGSVDVKLLNVRVFDEATKKAIYAKQTQDAQSKGISNCPHCVMENRSNKNTIWKLGEMDADHVTAWSKGGATNTNNCQMLCKTHNRIKGNI